MDWIISTKGFYISLFLDANEQWTKKSKIKKLVWKLCLNNVNNKFKLGYIHPNLAYKDRSIKIDFYLCCNNVLKQIKYASLVLYELKCWFLEHAYIPIL